MSFVRVWVKVTQSRQTLYNPVDCSPPRFLCPWISSGKNTGVGCHCPGILDSKYWKHSSKGLPLNFQVNKVMENMRILWQSKQRKSKVSLRTIIWKSRKLTCFVSCLSYYTCYSSFPDEIIFFQKPLLISLSKFNHLFLTLKTQWVILVGRMH